MDIATLQSLFTKQTTTKDNAKAQAKAQAKNYVVFSVINGDTLKRVYYTYDPNTKELVKRKDNDNAEIKNAKALIEYANYRDGKLYNDAIVQDNAKAKIDEMLNAKAKTNKD